MAEQDFRHFEESTVRVESAAVPGLQIDISVLKGGSGPPLVLLHGCFTASFTLLGVVRELRVFRCSQIPTDAIHIPQDRRQAGRGRVHGSSHGPPRIRPQLEAKSFQEPR